MININSSTKIYKVLFSKKIKLNNKKNYFFIVDDFFIKNKISSLNFPKNKTIYVKASEKNKSYDNISNIISKLLKKNIDKSSTIICVGGGIMQDISSFISFILFRGIEWVFIPTTLLSQGDSCIGSKIAINHKLTKNLLGGYYPPNKVILNSSFLDTLPLTQIYSGLGEIAHYYYLSNKKNYSYFKENVNKFNNNISINYAKIIEKSLLIKKHYIEKDEFENKERIYLNYGHTFGHAIESISNFKIPHGIAVSMGMHIANYISYKFGYFKVNELLEYQNPLEIIFKKYNNFSFSPQILMKKILQDKKVINNKARIIILKKIGSPIIKEFKKNSSLLFLLKEYKEYKGQL